MISRAALRTRWRSVLAITLMVGLIGGSVMATVAGANRTSTALERFNKLSRSADIEVLVVGVPDPARVELLRRAHGVKDVVILDAYGLVIPSFPQMQAIGAATDEAFGTVVDRGRVIAGRAADPASPDEITIGEGLAQTLHLNIGDHLRMDSYSQTQIDAIVAGQPDVGPLAGPTVAPRIVGIDRRPLDLSDRGASGGLLTLTPAFDRLHAVDMGRFGSRVRVRTDNGTAGVAAVLAEAHGIFGESMLSAQGLASESEGAPNQVEVIAVALWLLAAVIGLAGAAAIGFVLRRESSRLGPNQATLNALGLDRSQRVSALVAPGGVIAAGAVVIAWGVAVAASPIFPIGVARLADPQIGAHVNLVVLLVGAALVVVVVLATLLASAWRLTRNLTQSRSLGRGSVIVQRARGTGVPVTVTNGMRMALEADRAGTTLVRSAYVGSIIGIAGLSAVLLLAASLGHMIDTPKLYGWNWDFAEADNSNTPCGTDDSTLPRVRGVAGVAERCYENIQIDGHAVTGLAFRTLSGTTINPQIVHGRAPIGPDEIALGAKTMRRLDAQVGATVRASGSDPSKQQPYRVVGEAVFPVLGQPQVLSDGAAFTGEGFAPLLERPFSRFLVGRFQAGSDSTVTRHDIAAAGGLGDPYGARLPLELERLNQVRWLPNTLATILGALALMAVAYSVISSAFCRRREFAVIRALGFRPIQVATTIACQGITLILIGLMVGLPAGLIAGETAWRVITDQLGVDAPVVLPMGLLVFALPVAAGVGYLIAAFPARHINRTKPSVALRSE